MLLAISKLLFSSFLKPRLIPETPIDKAWWNGLSEEWKNIFLINQGFAKQGVDIFALQNEYLNRMNTAGKAGYSPVNRSLHDWQDDTKFGLGYKDLYARALRKGHMHQYDSIDLTTLARLETLYMVNGPGDLTPLKKLPHLKVLILNYCGIDNALPTKQQVLDLGPLRYLRELEVLHCSSSALQSLAPVKDLVHLQELRCDNNSITSLDPLKKLVNLKRLSFGSKVTDASAVTRLEQLEELYISGCKRLPDLSRLTAIRKLYIAESEMAIVNAGYRISNIVFLQNLKKLEYLDMSYTSYRGSLDALSALQNLQAVTLPRVSSTAMLAFKEAHKNCVIINSFEW